MPSPQINQRTQNKGSAGPTNPVAGSSTTTPLAQAKSQQSRIVNYSYPLTLAANNVPQILPGFNVPDGCTVRVRANNGTTAGNAAVIFVAGFPGAFKSGHATPLAPLDDIAWPVENGAHIWVYGKAADGVIVSVITSGGN